MNNSTEVPNRNRAEGTSLTGYGRVSRRAHSAQIILQLAAAALLIGSLKLPLWHIRLEAPQYRGEEALRIAVLPNTMRGDLKELNTLDQYIGVHIPPTLPQFKWLPATIVSAAVLGLMTCCLSRSIRSTARLLVPAALAVALGIAAVQANLQMRDIGHHRDQKTPLVGVHDFTPPFLGTTRIAQFQVTSALGLGAWLIGAAIALQTAAGLLTPACALHPAAAGGKCCANAAAQLKPSPIAH